MRYLLIPKFCAATGYSEKAVRRKIEEGVWIESREYRRAPDGHILIDVEAVAEVEAAEADPIKSGVYLLFLQGALVYVGRSDHVRRRINEHVAAGREFDESRIIPCDEVTSVWLEKELIRALHPGTNKARFARHSLDIDAAIGGFTE